MGVLAPYCLFFPDFTREYSGSRCEGVRIPVGGIVVDVVVIIIIRDLKQPRRRAEWTPTESVLTKPATSAHVSDVVHIAFRT